jgi:hypothetical protein
MTTPTTLHSFAPHVQGDVVRGHALLHGRWRRIAPVNSRGKRWRIVQDRRRLWQVGVCDLVMDIRCALHNCRVHLTPWPPMVESG